MKFYALVALFSVAIVATLLTHSSASNSTWGRVGPYDTLFHRDVVYAKSHWLQIVSRDVVYPPKGYLNYYNITCIKAIDRKRKDGGYASLYRGGPGFRNATLHLKSLRGHGLNFTIEYYGRR